MGPLPTLLGLVTGLPGPPVMGGVPFRGYAAPTHMNDQREHPSSSPPFNSGERPTAPHLILVNDQREHPSSSPPFNVVSGSRKLYFCNGCKEISERCSLSTGEPNFSRLDLRNPTTLHTSRNPQRQQRENKMVSFHLRTTHCGRQTSHTPCGTRPTRQICSSTCTSCTSGAVVVDAACISFRVRSEPGGTT